MLTDDTRGSDGTSRTGISIKYCDEHDFNSQYNFDSKLNDFLDKNWDRNQQNHWFISTLIKLFPDCLVEGVITQCRGTICLYGTDIWDYRP